MTDRDKLIKANHKEGMEIDQLIRKDHPDNDEIALLRKEVKHLAEALNVTLSEEFEAYYNKAESVKASVKERLK